MIRKVLIVVAIVIALGLALLWLMEGGAAAVANTAKKFSDPTALLFGGSISGGSITLPGQPAYTQGTDISQYVQQADQLVANGSNGNSQQTSQDLGTNNTPSPFRGKVTIAHIEPNADASKEYVELNAGYGFTTSISISGWSLQSAVSGMRVYLPEGASMFVMGVVNNVGPISLTQGGSAIITTGASPVGVSFEENTCSGYLAQLRPFTPAISNECPNPKDALPETAANLQTFGASCFDYVSTLQGCDISTPPASLSAACRSFIANTYTYNGCVNIYRGKSSFTLPSWRLYLNQNAGVWGSHDVIRLLDSRGRIVDSLTY